MSAKIGKMKNAVDSIYERLGLELTGDRVLDIRDHLRGIIARKQNAPDYERMSAYVAAKFSVRMSAGYLERLVN